MLFAQQLKKYRNGKGFTQEQLAEICNVSRQAVAKWEAGASLPDVENLLQIAQIFGVSLELLLTGEDKNINSGVPTFADAIHTGNEKLINEGLKKAMSCNNPSEEINAFISYIGEMLSCERVYIFEKDPGNAYSNTYEWCNRGIIPQIEFLQGIAFQEMTPWLERFENNEFVYVDDIEKLAKTEPGIYKWLKPQKIRSLIAYPLFNGQGFIGVDNPAMAFVHQTAVLLEIAVHFIENMLRRRNLVKELLIETDQNDYLNSSKHIARYFVNVITGKIDFAPGALKALGYDFTLESIPQLMKLLQRHPECADHIVRDGYQKVLRDKIATTIEFVFYTKDDKVRWSRLSMRPFFDYRGKLLHIYGTMQDVSEQHEIVDRYNAFTSRLSGGMHICRLGEGGYLAYASDNLCALLGYTREEFEQVVGNIYTRAMVEEDKMIFRNFISVLGAKPGIDTCEYRLIHKNGSYIRVIDTMESVRDANGVMYGYANVMDVTAIHKAMDLSKKNELAQLAELDKQFAIVHALSLDYKNVFLVDLKKNTARIIKLQGYAITGMNKNSVAPFDYYEACCQYIAERVHPDDQLRMKLALKPETLCEQLKEKQEQIFSYRILEAGKIHHYKFKCILLDEKEFTDDRGNVILAFKNIDALVEMENNYKQAIQSRSQVIETILKLFGWGYYIDLENNYFK